MWLMLRGEAAPHRAARATQACHLIVIAVLLLVRLMKALSGGIVRRIRRRSAEHTLLGHTKVRHAHAQRPLLHEP